MLKARINKIEEAEGVKYEIYIPKENEASILIYLDKDSFDSFINAALELNEGMKHV
ncbi:MULTISPECIES: hypothetical protein [Leptospira]|uniref:hypothetical protein n=1 Tax=Leptospira TaxID=171 RepID=UPI0012B6A2E8|nr:MULTISPECIES: hypothetical protein [Leptospira]UML79936.1 hypothetical protein FH602_16895 [Leptospira kirschneri]UMQ56632.1 hypothetical protein FH585_01570 [Leptospira interrogans]UNE66418.1 hypothetical protein FH588_18015 [Leptospira interrogans]UNE69184.1 hypothetical protein FH588_23175 [Leptospira interrogans]UNE69247.1 hypothetical protein FH588_23060 [Leptospira interrogans]